MPTPLEVARRFDWVRHPAPRPRPVRCVTNFPSHAAVVALADWTLVQIHVPDRNWRYDVFYDFRRGNDGPGPR